MNSELAESTQGRFIMKCEELRLDVEFSLRPGQFARIGSASIMEISLPIAGMRDEECRLDCDLHGHLLVTYPGEVSGTLLALPARLPMGPYFFAIDYRQTSPTQPRSRVPQIPRANLRAPMQQAIEAPIRTDLPPWKLAAAIAGACLIIGSLLWRNFRRAEPVETIAAERNTVGSVVTPIQDVKLGPVGNPAAKVEPVALPPESSGMDLTELAKRVRPCVFHIKLLDDRDDEVGSGTGFAISADGLVATCQHLLRSGKRMVAVTEQESVFKVDQVVVEDSTIDLAIIKLEAKNIPFLELGSTTKVEVGQRVAVYGSPKGLAGTLTDGIISAKRSDPDNTLLNGASLLQTSAAISPGSSGSPLLDAEGKVLGIMKGMLTGNTQNLNFAVPVEALAALWKQADRILNGGGLHLPQAAYAPAPARNDFDAEFHADPDAVRLEASGESLDAIETMNLASRLGQKYPGSAAAQYEWGRAAVRLGLHREAVGCFKRAIEINPKDIRSWLSTGSTQMSLGNSNAAIEAFERVAFLQPDNPWAWKGMALAQALLGKWKAVTMAVETLAGLNMDEARKITELILETKIAPTDVRSALVQIAPPASQDSPTKGGETHTAPTFVVDGVPPGDVLYIRSGPGTEFPSVGRLALGVTVELKSDKTNKDSEWIEIRSPYGDGWVRSQFLGSDSPRSIALRCIRSFLVIGCLPDLDKELSAYAPAVSVYFDDTDATPESIRPKVAAYRRKWPVRDFQLLELESTRLTDSDQLHAVYRFRYSVTGPGGKRSGVIRQMTCFELDESNLWKIVAIQTVD
jgi:S1-C subfamily serine protease